MVRHRNQYNRFQADTRLLSEAKISISLDSVAKDLTRPDPPRTRQGLAKTYHPCSASVICIRGVLPGVRQRSLSGLRFILLTSFLRWILYGAEDEGVGVEDDGGDMYTTPYAETSRR